MLYRWSYIVCWHAIPPGPVLKEKRFVRDLARQRIRWLLSIADKVHREDPWLADRYVKIAMRLAQKARIHYPPELKARACRKCGTYLAPGVTAQVRILGGGREKYVAVKCLKCGYQRRYPLGRDKRREGTPWIHLYLYKEKKYMRRP